MTNAVEVGRTALTIDGLNLLLRKVVIEEMALDGVQLDTPRKTSGAIVKAPAVTAKKTIFEKLNIPPLKIPSAQEILEKEQLQSVKLVESVQAEIKNGKEKWQSQLAALPDKNKVEDYRRRLKGLKSATKGGLLGILGGAGEAIEIEKEIQNDINSIQAVKVAWKVIWHR